MTQKFPVEFTSFDIRVSTDTITPSLILFDKQAPPTAQSLIPFCVLSRRASDQTRPIVNATTDFTKVEYCCKIVLIQLNVNYVRPILIMAITIEHDYCSAK